jgi:hypothetical protein
MREMQMFRPAIGGIGGAMAPKSADMAEGRADHEFSAAASAGFRKSGLNTWLCQGRAPEILLYVVYEIRHAENLTCALGKPITKSHPREIASFSFT